MLTLLSGSMLLHAQDPAAEEGESAEAADRSATAALPERDPALLAALTADLRQRYSKSAKEWPTPEIDPGVVYAELSTPTIPAGPPDNPTSPAKATLGLSLFFDPRLSGSQQISCANCHSPELGWADGRSFAAGNFRRTLKRHTPSLLGIGHAATFFWDGRQSTLEDQATEVITNPDEMAGDPSEVVARLQKESEFYAPLFTKAFGDATIDFQRVVQALAAFQRSLKVGRAPFDKFIAGKPGSLSDAAVRGLHLFRTKGRCLNCHQGPMLQSDTFHNLGLTYYGRKYEDLGRYKVTGKPEDVGRFKTPTLRNVARTGPWMHNGLFPSLDGVLRLYNAGMPRPRPKAGQENDPLFPKTDALLKPLKMDAGELADLKAFLEALNEPQVRILSQPFPPIAPSQGS
ncbi:cytochrome c peroxidase [Verrucomicrobium sp. BvORR106]|uniref:cytochrome-c peroxidase n=1 Tax=Verrucomicrobium sp. BvORR106 TaxID=1403819 RepID=UPI000570883C|nr:cytochrome c peroxidase [Verrucomicrobium sp. BvORR106]